MIKCPRCAQPVDETVRTTCPLCFTPIMPAETAAPAEATTPVAAGVSVPNGMPQTAPAYPSPMPGGVPLPMPPMPMNGNGNGAPPVGVANLNAPPAGMQSLNGAQPLNGAAPLNAAPSLNASSIPTLAPIEQPLAPGSIRTLNGDVIQSTAPAPPLQPNALPGGYGSGGPTPQNSHRVGNLPTLMRDEDTGPKPGIGKTIYGVLLALVLFGGAGWGLKTLLTPKPGPKEVAQQVLKAAGTGDYKTIYDMVDLTDEEKTKYPDAQAFADDKKKQLDALKSLGGEDAINSVQQALKNAKVGEPKIDNENATVPVTVTATLAGQSRSGTQDLTLKKVGGDWKISGSSVNTALGSSPNGGFTGAAGR